MHPINYSRREVIELMMAGGFHGNVDRFMAILAEAQNRALVFAVGMQKARDILQGEQINQTEATNG